MKTTPLSLPRRMVRLMACSLISVAAITTPVSSVFADGSTIQPTWSEEFNGTGPADPAIWWYEEGYKRNNELQYYTPNNGWQENGMFVIEAREETTVDGNGPNATTYDYTSSSIKTEGNFSWMYGRAQIRAQIPVFAGMWPAIWQVGDTGEWPYNGECDIMEYYQNKILANCAVGSGQRWTAKWDGSNRSITSLTSVDPDWKTEFHIWTIQWDEDNVRLYCDNILMNTIPQSWLVNNGSYGGSPSEPFKQPHSLWLNLAVGGGGGGSVGNTTFPQRYYIDYWRIWEGATSNVAPTDIQLSSNSVNEGLPVGTVVADLTALDADPAEVFRYTLVPGAGDDDNASFSIPEFVSDSTTLGQLQAAAVLDYDDGATRSIRVRVTDIEGATYEEILTINVQPDSDIVVSASSVTVPEGGSQVFDVKLRHLPAGNITVNVSNSAGDADVTVQSGATLTFTPSNGTTWQQVTLAAAEDADITNGSATILCEDPSAIFASATLTASEFENDNQSPVVDAGTDDTVFLTGGAGGTVTPGADIFLDAGLDDGVNATWEDSLGLWNAAIDPDVSFVANAGSAYFGITSAYDFPGGLTSSGGTSGASLQDLGVDTSPITLEVWFKPDASASYPANGQVLWETGGGTGLGIFYNNGFVETAHDSNQGELSADVSALTGEFIQVVVTYDPLTSTDNFNLYINGTLAATGSRNDGDMCGSDGAGLGKRGGSNTGGAGTGTSNAESFDGLIALFRSYHNQVLIPNEVQANYDAVVGEQVDATLDGTVTDANGETPVTLWTQVSGPSTATFADASSVDTTVSFGVHGTYVLGLTADDGTSVPGYDEVTITVASPGGNTPPAWTTNPVNESDAPEDAAYSSTLADDAGDVDSDPLTFAKLSGPAWLSVASDGTLSGTPTNAEVGLNTFTVTVSDGIDAPASATLNITVVNVNDAPVWTSNPVNEASGYDGAAYSATLAGYVSDDDGDALTFSKVSGPAWLSVAGDGTLSGTPSTGDVGPNTFTVDVSDSIATAVQATLNITVYDSLPPMVDPSTPAAALPLSGGTHWLLDFSDEFNGTSLDTTKWGVDVSTSSRNPRPTQGIDDWWWKSENVSLDGAGNLQLDVVKHDQNTMHCGSISSDGLYEPTYGYLEARIQIADTTKSTHTAFWLQGPNMMNSDPADGTGNDGAEVDIFESAWFGDFTKAVVHIDGYDEDHVASTKQYSTPGLHSGYHVFGLEWDSSSMKIYYDGVEKVSYSGIWVPQVAEWLWLSVGASFGDVGTFTSEPDGLLTSAKVDYVRVWQAAPNTAPAFTADPIATADATEDAAYSDTLAGSATDGDGDTLNYSKVSGPAWLNVATDGTLSGTPAQSDVGANAFTVQVDDGNGGSDTATLNVTVNNVNDVPVFAADPFSAADASKDVAYSDSISGSATDGDGDPLSYAKVSGPAWLSVATNGALSGTPSSGDLGLNVFSVSVNDGNGGSDAATLNLTVTEVNNAPVFSADPISTADATEDAAYGDTLAGSATDGDGDTLSYSKLSGPAWLNVATDGTLSGTPVQSDVGANAFSVQVDDGNGGTDTATLNITVNNVNDAPLFASDPISGAEAFVATAYSASLAGSASDDDGDGLTYSKLSGPAWLSVVGDGTLSGTPAAGDTGANAFTVQVDDGNGGSDTATLDIQVSAGGAEEVVALAEVFAHNERDNFGGNPTDLIIGSGMNGYPDTGNPGWPTGEGLPSTWLPTSTSYKAEHQSRDFLAAETPSEDLDPYGTLLPDGVGPTNGKIGWYVIDIGAVTTNLKDLHIWHIREIATRIAADFNVYVAEAPSVPVPHGPTGTTAQDYDFASGGWTQVATGVAGIFRDVTVTPLDGATARYIGLEIMANGGATDERVGFAEVGLTRISGAANAAPTWAADPVNEIDATEDAAYSSTLADDASDAESDPLAFAMVSGPAWLSVAANGDLSGTPAQSDVGANAFTVSVSDGVNPAVVATLNITVNNVNDAPAFSADPIAGSDASEDAAYSDSLAGSATDADDDPLSYTKVSGPAWLSVAANGSLSGTPAQSDVGANAFTVSVSDGNGGSDTATLNITVNNVNDAPVFAADPFAAGNGTEDEAYADSIAGSATDEDGDTLTYAKVSGPAWLSVAANGDLSGTPGSADVGLNAFTVSVSDGNGGSDSATLEITVDAGSAYPIGNYASSEFTASGSVGGSQADTFASDNGYEVLTEVESGGKPSNRHSLLEHQWTFDVAPGGLITFYVEAHHNANTEGDDFRFAFSTDGVSYTDMVTVTKTGDDDTPQFYSLPGGTSGTVYVRVTDTDQTSGNNALDSLYVDYLVIVSDELTSAPGVASNPDPADAATGVTLSPTLTWTAGIYTATHQVYFGTNPAPGPGEYQGGFTEASFAPGSLSPNTTYYWAVDEENSIGTTAGATWSFTTGASTPEVSVADIAMSSGAYGGNRYSGFATVTILDNQAQPVSGATVDVTWSGAAPGTTSGVTDGSGQITFESDRVKNGGTFTLTVDNVTASGAIYTPAANVETSDSITAP